MVISKPELTVQKITKELDIKSYSSFPMKIVGDRTFSSSKHKNTLK